MNIIAAKFAKQLQKKMEGISLGSEADYDWYPFIIRVPESYKSDHGPTIIRAAVPSTNSSVLSVVSMPPKSKNFFKYNPADKDDDDDEEDADELKTKEDTTKLMRKKLGKCFVFQYDDTFSCYPMFVGGTMPDSRDIAGLFSLKVET